MAKKLLNRPKGRSVLNKLKCEVCGKDWIPLLEVNLLEFETSTVNKGGAKPQSVTVDVIQSCRNCEHIHGVGVGTVQIITNIEGLKKDLQKRYPPVRSAEWLEAYE